MENTIKSKKRILVTGSNGFIGHHFCSYMMEHGYYTIGIGRTKTSKANVAEYYSCDLATDEVFRIVGNEIKQIDAIIHLAADMRKEPHNISVVTDNCGGTQRLLELCEIKQIPAFLQLSSLPLIGKPDKLPITEDYKVEPPTVYHATKRMEELLADYAYRKRGIRTASFRITSPTGEGMNESTILPTFVKCAIKNEDILLYGKGTRKQTYIHVLDIARALECALLSDCHGVYNLASYNCISNFDLAKAVTEICKSKSKIIFNGKNDPMDEYYYEVDISKIKQDTGFEPQIGIEEIIRDMEQHLKENK
ncbi:MAG: NAD(P)-dependent oxidoreductase [Clostridia bacterium]|nr:NAD(P)-dependent oxidoreductase [Clostridia bacterium]